MTDLLQIQNLSLFFPQGSDRCKVVDQMCFSIQEGESLGLVGESGSGKSVSALAIMGLLPSEAQISGSIRFHGGELTKLAPEELRRIRGREIAMIFQEPMTALNPVMSVGRQVAEALEVHEPGLSRLEVKRRVVEAFRTVALPEPELRFDDYPHQFSGGQRQRIMIAMALIHRPKLLIADEPTTALDVTVQAQILDLLADLRRRFQLSILFISHDLAVVSKIADRVLVMRQGLAVEEGTSKDIFQNPVHPYTRSLLGAIPTLKTRRDVPLATLDKIVDTTQGKIQEIEEGHWVRR